MRRNWIRLRWWHVPVAILLLVVGLLRLPFLEFRHSEERQRRELLERGAPEPTFHTYEWAGGRVHYVHVGEEGRPLVVFVHGAPGSSSMFYDYLADSLLLERAQLVAVDRPGYGGSDYGRSEPSLQRQAAALAPVLQRHRAPARILVGHSMGGPVIARLAMDHPHLVDGLLFVAGSLDPELEPREWWRPWLDGPIGRLLPGSFRVCNEEILPLWQELEAMLPLWSRVRCPVRIVQGARDGLVPPGNAEFALAVLEAAPSLRLDLLPHGNHFILWSERRRIRRHILDLLPAPEAGR